MSGDVEPPRIFVDDPMEVVKEVNIKETLSDIFPPPAEPFSYNDFMTKLSAVRDASKSFLYAAERIASSQNDKERAWENIVRAANEFLGEQVRCYTCKELYPAGLVKRAEKLRYDMAGFGKRIWRMELSEVSAFNLRLLELEKAYIREMEEHDDRETEKVHDDTEEMEALHYRKCYESIYMERRALMDSLWR